MSTITKPQDLAGIISAMDYKHVSLKDSTGKVLVPYNPLKEPIGERLKKVLKRLQNGAPGLYIVSFRNNYGKKFPEFDYQIQTGETLSAAPQPVIIQHPAAASEPVRGWNDALSDKQRIAQLEAENARLLEKIALAEAEEEEEEEEEETPMQEPASFGKSLAEILPQFLPVLDQYFQEKAKDREIELLKIKAMLNQRPAQPLILRKQRFSQIPEPGTPEFEEYINYLHSLPDETLEKEINRAAKLRPELTDLINSLIFEDEETDEK